MSYFSKEDKKRIIVLFKSHTASELSERLKEHNLDILRTKSTTRLYQYHARSTTGSYKTKEGYIFMIEEISEVLKERKTQENQK